MDFERVIAVLEITLPVFAMIGLGKVLSIKGFITEERKEFINEFVYTFSLPSLIFINVAVQRFNNMWNPALIIPGILGIVILVILYMTMNKIFGYKGGFAAAWVFGTFWANITYVGFPMSELAFGNAGISLAAVYNAYYMLIYIPLGFALIGFYGAANDSISPVQRITNLFKNPILVAAVAGTIVAFTGEYFRVEQISENGVLMYPLKLSPVVLGGLNVIEAFFRLVGSMGLPLALVAIGAAMNLKHLTNRIFALSAVIIGKLILLPSFTLGVTLYLYPDAPGEILGTAVLLSAMPNAVASYVIAKQVGVEEGFVSSMLVLSTGLSIITIPAWLYVVI